MPSGGKTDHPDVWGGQRLDLEAYLHRIGIDDRTAEPTLETLRKLQRAHITSIPFENGETILGRPTPLDVESLQDKMVRHQRGGYCFEHAGLFAAALERLGFGVTGLISRITMGADKLLPATHAAIKVATEDNDRTWISDVGRGGGPSSRSSLRMARHSRTTGTSRCSAPNTPAPSTGRCSHPGPKVGSTCTGSA